MYVTCIWRKFIFKIFPWIWISIFLDAPMVFLYIYAWDLGMYLGGTCFRGSCFLPKTYTVKFKMFTVLRSHVSKCLFIWLFFFLRKEKTGKKTLLDFQYYCTCILGNIRPRFIFAPFALLVVNGRIYKTGRITMSQTNLS